MDTVSPARSRVRSSTLCARRSGLGSLLVGTSKRQLSMPRFQSLQTKAISVLPLSSAARALTNRALSCSHSPHLGASMACGWRQRPLSSVLPEASSLPLQPLTATLALGTGLPLSRRVTQASEPARPCLKCTPRLVTSALVRTYMVRCLKRGSSRFWPSTGEAISSTWKPGCSGMPTTSNGRGSPPSGLGSSVALAPPAEASSETMRDCTMSWGMPVSGSSSRGLGRAGGKDWIPSLRAWVRCTSSLS